MSVSLPIVAPYHDIQILQNIVAKSDKINGFEKYSRRTGEGDNALYTLIAFLKDYH